MVVDKTVKVSKEADELADGIARCIVSIRKALADGWQPGSDLPVVLSSVMADLVPAVQGVEKLGAEKKENVQAFVTAFALSGAKVAGAFLQE